METFSIGTPTVSGSDAVDTNYMLNNSSASAKIKKLRVVPVVSVSTHASNYITITVKKASTTLATFTTNSSGGAALTAGTPVDLTITGSGKDLEIADGGVITVDVTKAGTGPAYEFFAEAQMEPVRI